MKGSRRLRCRRKQQRCPAYSLLLDGSWTGGGTVVELAGACASTRNGLLEVRARPQPQRELPMGKPYECAGPSPTKYKMGMRAGVIEIYI